MAIHIHSLQKLTIVLAVSFSQDAVRFLGVDTFFFSVLKLPVMETRLIKILLNTNQLKVNFMLYVSF